MTNADSHPIPSVSVPASDDPATHRLAPLHVEVLDRRARVRLRARIDSLPCIVGRGYGCGLVLDDRFVSAEHASIERSADGAVVLRDLNSVNGVYDIGSDRPMSCVRVEAGTTIRLGQTLLRFHTADEPVAPALPLPRAFATPGWSVLLAFLVLFGVAGLSTYLETYSKLTAGPFVFGAAALAVVASCWAGAWALFSRVLQHQSHVAEHCVIVCAFLSLYILAGWFTDYYAFAFAADRSATALEWALPTLLLAGMLYAHLRFSSTMASRQLLLRALGVAGGAAGLAGVVALAEALEPNWSAVASFRGGLKPPLFRLATREDLEGFFTRVEHLKAEVDARADDGDGAAPAE